MLALVVAAFVAAAQARGAPRIIDGEAPVPLAYTCRIQQTVPFGQAPEVRLSYDHGKFRQMFVDVRSRRTYAIRLYNRDGQVVCFDTTGTPPWTAGVSYDTVRYHLARHNPADFAVREGLAGSREIVVPGPRPPIMLQPFSGFASQGYTRAGNARLDGRTCSVYAKGATRLSVWNGYVVAYESPERSWTIHEIVLSKSLNPRLFELPPGTLVKVPRELHVKVPPTVKREEYPGWGIQQRTLPMAPSVGRRQP